MFREARIEVVPQIISRQVWIYVIFDRQGYYVRHVQTSPGEYENVEYKYKPGGEIEPFLKLPEELFKSIIEAGQMVVPVTNSTQWHLEDCITVRDRLLTMVEGFAAAPRVIERG